MLRHVIIVHFTFIVTKLLDVKTADDRTLTILRNYINSAYTHECFLNAYIRYIKQPWLCVVYILTSKNRSLLENFKHKVLIKQLKYEIVQKNLIGLGTRTN